MNLISNRMANSDPNAPLAFSASWLQPINEEGAKSFLKGEQVRKM